MKGWSKYELLSARPKEKLTVTEWAEKCRVLTDAAIRGPYQSNLVPVLRPIMDAANNPQVETIVFCKSAQIGGTDAMLNILGFYIEQDPSSIMLVLADEDTAVEEMSRRRVQPMFQDSPALQHLPNKDQWTKKELSFVNGSRLTFGWASSVARLASRPFRIVCCDEINKPGYGLTTNEGDTIGLAKERTNTFPNRLILLLSTPTYEGGRITEELASCDVIYDWHVPCPHCGQMQPLRWSPKHAHKFQDGKYRAEDGTLKGLGKVVWEEGRNATREQIGNAKYQCGSCGKFWNNVQKNVAVTNGKMVARATPAGDEKKIGFHANRLYSLFPGGRLDSLVSDWVSAIKTGQSKQIQNFVNSSLAEPWQNEISVREEDVILALKDQRPRGLVPDEVDYILVGADTQDNGFWYEVRGFQRGRLLESWQIREGFVPADWSTVHQEELENREYPYHPAFDGLRNVLFEHEYKKANGEVVPVSVAGIDAMGHKTTEVYDFCRFHARVKPIQGMPNRSNRPVKWTRIDTYPGTSKPIPGGVMLLQLDVNSFKDELNSKLQIRPMDPGAWHLHSETGLDWAQQLCSEYLDEEKQRWVCPSHRENHAWDCSVYVYALAEVLGLKYTEKKAVKSKPKKQKVNPYTNGVNPFAQ